MPVDPQMDASERLLEKTLAWAKEMHSLASGYDQVVIVAGYAAFLTVWAQTAPHLARSVVLLSGALIGISLVLFVSFHVLQMAVRSHSAIALGIQLRKVNPTPIDQLQVYITNQQKAAKSSSIILVVWPFVFYPAVITGIGAALLISGSAFWSVVSSAHGH